MICCEGCERLRADNAAMFKNLDEQTTTALLATSKWKQAEAEVERLRDECMERAVRQKQSEERLAKVVEVLKGNLGSANRCLDEPDHPAWVHAQAHATVSVCKTALAAAQPLDHDYVPCEGECKNKGCHYVQGGESCGATLQEHRAAAQPEDPNEQHLRAHHIPIAKGWGTNNPHAPGCPGCRSKKP